MFGQEYGDGQHVTLIGPTQRGKSTLCFQMLGEVISPDRKATVLHGKIKGRDPVIPRASKRLNLAVTNTYPPSPVARYRGRNGNGYILRPLDKPGESTAEENVILHEHFKRAIHANYAQTKKPTITVVDESHQAQQDLKLQKQLEGPLMRGAPHNAEWNNIQRGRFVSYHCYDAPEWIIIFYDPDISNQRRYAEIGGSDPREITDVTSSLRTKRVASGGTISEAFAIRRSGPEYYIIGM